MIFNYYNILQKGLFFKYLIVASVFIVVIVGLILFTTDSFKINTYYNGLSLASKAGFDYQEGNWGEAGIGYIEAKKFQPDSDQINYNLANAYYKQGRYKEASIIYNKLIDDKNSKLDKATLYYNLGTAKFRQHALFASFDAFKAALLLNEKDEKTRQNFLFVFGQYMKMTGKGPTGKPVKERPREGTKQIKNGPPNGGGTPTDPSPGPYQVSDKEMDHLLSLSKIHERVPKGTKSIKGKVKVAKPVGEDY